MKCAFIAVTMLWLCASVVAAPPDGKALYQENCASCHGQNAKGDTGSKLVGDAREWQTKLFERGLSAFASRHRPPIEKRNRTANFPPPKSF
jgi:mono/diheme cytochrome c family protein